MYLDFDIEDIYFFEVNTSFISSSVLKTSDFSRVSENSDAFNSRDEIYLVFIEKSIFFSFCEGCSKRIAYFYLETSNFKLAKKCSFHAIKELPVARNAKLQPMKPLPEGVTIR